MSASPKVPCLAALEHIRKRIASRPHGDRDLDIAIACAIAGDDFDDEGSVCFEAYRRRFGCESFTASVEAAMRLCAKVHPRSLPSVWQVESGEWQARLRRPGVKLAPVTTARTAALAVVDACLACLIADFGRETVAANGEFVHAQAI